MTGAWPCAYEVRRVTSIPASAHSRATIAACTSEPPASTSARSRHDRRWMRRRPAAAARSPILAMVALLASGCGDTTRPRVLVNESGTWYVAYYAHAALGRERPTR